MQTPRQSSVYNHPRRFHFMRFPRQGVPPFLGMTARSYRLQIRARGEILREKTLSRASFLLYRFARRFSLPLLLSQKICILQILARGEILREKTLASKFSRLYYKKKSAVCQSFNGGYGLSVGFCCDFCAFYLLYCVILNATLVI